MDRVVLEFSALLPDSALKLRRANANGRDLRGIEPSLVEQCHEVLAVADQVRCRLIGPDVPACIGIVTPGRFSKFSLIAANTTREKNQAEHGDGHAGAHWRLARK